MIGLTFPLGATGDGGLSDFFNSGTWLVIRNLTIFFVIVAIAFGAGRFVGKILL